MPDGQISDGSRILSVVLIACFKTRNRDSDSAFSWKLNNKNKGSFIQCVEK